MKKKMKFGHWGVFKINSYFQARKDIFRWENQS